MKRAVVILMLFVSIICFAQQDSKIKIKGDTNDASNFQELGDSSQKSDIDIDGKGNRVQSNQKVLAMQPKPKEEKGMMEYVNNANVITGLIVSAVALWGIIKGIPFIKESLKKR